MIRRLLALACSLAAAPLLVGGERFTVTGDDGVTLTLQTDRPLRVISLAPALTEIVESVQRGAIHGPYRQLIGVSNYCNYPASVTKLPRYGGPFDPEYERILSAKPDLVLAMGMMPKSVQDKLRSLDIPLLFLREPRTLVEIDLLNSRLDRIFSGHCGHTLKAELVTSRDCGMQGIYAPPNDHLATRIEQPVASCMILSAGQPLWTAGRDTFLNDLLRVAGCRNSAAQYSGWSAIELEQIAKLKPDWLLFIGKPAAAGSPLDRLIKVGRIKILVLDEDMASRPGPRIFTILHQVESALGTLPEEGTEPPPASPKPQPPNPNPRAPTPDSALPARRAPRTAHSAPHAP